MDKLIRVAFTGPAGAGKTTQAQMLRAKYKGDVLSFATPLKKVTRDLFGEQMEDSTFARQANQQVGVLCRNLAGPGFWVEKLVAKVSPNRNCFVDDMRFMNEYHILKRLGFIIVRLYADEKALGERRPEMSPLLRTHESEQSWVSIKPDLYLDTSTADAEFVHKVIVEALPNLTREPLTPTP